MWVIDELLWLLLLPVNILLAFVNLLLSFLWL